MFGNVFVHIALELWGSMFCIVVMVLIWLGKEDGSKADRKLVQFEGLVAAMLFFDTVYRILESMSEAVGRLSVQISLGVNLIMVNMTLLYYADYLYQNIRGKADFPVATWKRGITALIAANIILILSSFAMGQIFYFDAANRYCQGEYFYLIYLLGGAGICWCLAMLVFNKSCFTRTNYYFSLLCLVLTLACCVIECLNPKLDMLSLFICAAALLTYIGWQLEHVAQDKRRAEELLEKEQMVSKLDNYVDVGTLNILSKKNADVSVVIYTVKKTRLSNKDVETFNRQYPKLEVKYTGVFHDRFLILDDERAYHIGASLKDAGKKCFAISLLNDSGVIYDILQRLDIEAEGI